MALEHRSAAAGAGGWIGRFIFFWVLFLALGLGVGCAYSYLWLSLSGDAKFDEVVERQSRGEFVLFSPLGMRPGLGASDYRMALYDKFASAPDTVLVGASSGGMVRASFFQVPFLNMAGSADSIESLMDTVKVLADKRSRPKTVIIAADPFWFSESWNPKLPESKHSPSASLVLPWKLLFEGKIGKKDFFAPFSGAFKSDRFGAAAQLKNEGFGPDGSWYPLGIASGKVLPDRRFDVAAGRCLWRQGEFVPQKAIPKDRLETFADVCFFLRSRGMVPIVFLAPAAPRISELLAAADENYPHFFRLRDALGEKGIAVFDVSASIGTDASASCEFVSWNVPGEVLWAKALRYVGDRSKSFQAKLQLRELVRTATEWPGHVFAPSATEETFVETDFLGLGCMKKR